MKLYILLLGILISFTSCAKTQPAGFPMAGTWQADISLQGVGNIATVISFEADEKQGDTFLFHAYSKKNVDRQILGFWKSTLARWFSSSFTYGSLLHIMKGRLYPGDSLSGILASSAGNFNFNGRLMNGHITATLSNKNYVAKGSFIANKGALKQPLRNYPEIFQSVVSTTRNKIYDRKLLDTREWRKFEREMRRISKLSTDDATFVMAFFYYSGKYLPFTHYSLLRPLKETDSAIAGNDDINVHFEEKNKDVAYLQISSFMGSAAEMESAFTKITSGGYKTLIVDLRDNGGGSIEPGMTFIRHLVPDSLYGGIFLTQKYFATHTSLPSASQYYRYPCFSEANYDLLMKGISSQEGVRLMAYPMQPLFRGKLYILTNNNTASTCEPLVYGLQQKHLATIVGERTAGAMLCGETFEVNSGYSLFLPVATYYTSDGIKLDKRGVDPDIKVNAATALETALTLANH
jgi:hypothetical protein